MSGRDRSQDAKWQGVAPVIILIAPQMGENIGASARAMWNFGVTRLRLVAPRDGWPNPKAQAMASGAGQVMDHITLPQNIDEALGDLNYVFATTARKRDLTKEVLTPEQAMIRAHKMINGGQKLGILFGPERAGLENMDIARANALISVPVNPAFASLNLAQSVLLLCYEWRKIAMGKDILSPLTIELAQVIERQKLYERMEQALCECNFFWPENKADSMRQTLRNMISRLDLTSADVRVLHGVIKALEKK